MTEPIKTIKNGNTTYKVVSDDLRKLKRKNRDRFLKLYIELSHLNDNIKDFVTHTGVSTPAKSDTYDSNLGEIIAFKKAKIKNNDYRARKLAKMTLTLFDLIEELNKEIEILDSSTEMDEKYLSKL